MTINIYIANTPFHLFVISTIINNYYNDNSTCRNIVFSTVKNNIIKSELYELVQIERGIKSISYIRKLKRIVYSNNELSFFIPHLSNLLSSYLFEIYKSGIGKMHIYYEGIALLYPSVKKTPFRVILKRYIIAFLSGITYKNSDVLYPESLCKDSICFSPFPLEKTFLEIRKLELNLSEYKSDNFNILILTSRVISSETISKLFNELKKNYSDNCNIIYLKPHYELNNNDCLRIVDMLKFEFDCEVILLDKVLPIELLIDKINFSIILTQHFSSALLNLRGFMGNLKKIVLLEDIKNSFIKEIAISYGILNK